MEHNEYALHKLQVKLKRSVRQSVPFTGETKLAGYETATYHLNIVAPKGFFGDELLRLHLKHHYANMPKLGSGETHEVIQHVQEPLEMIVRFDAAYRGRM